MNRHVWVDWMRTVAIFFVIVIHSTEPFYIGGEGSLILSQTNALWVAFFDSFCRACVPLFVIASCFLQLPLDKPVSQFFRKRFVRVLVPFFLWTAAYAIAWGNPVDNFKDLLLNFNYAAGHLWFVYMLIGVYLLIPMLSPWASQVSKRQLTFYLAVCLFTTLIPFVREIAGDGTPAVIYGPSGIPNFSKYPLWGECSWNQYGVFYYLSGFIGYLLLALYVRRFCANVSRRNSLIIGASTFIVGFAICFFGFLSYVNASASGYPIEGPIGLVALWETPWFYDSTGVALMAVGWIFIFRLIREKRQSYRHFALPLAKASYGVYLMHMFILVEAFEWYSAHIAGIGIWTTPAVIIATAITTFTLSSALSLLLGKIPRIGHYIVG